MKRKVYSKQMRSNSRDGGAHELGTSLPKVDVLIKSHEKIPAGQVHRQEADQVADKESVQTDYHSTDPSTEPERPLEYMYPTINSSPCVEVAYTSDYLAGTTFSPSYGSATYTSLQTVAHVDSSQAHNAVQAYSAVHEAHVPQHWDQENSDRFYPWKYSDGYPLTSVPTDYNQPESRVPVRRTAGPAKGSRRRRKRLQTPVQRSAANMRERRRMCHLNVAFDLLKDRLPNVKDKKKLSRIQTLKAAIYYIQLLQDSLNLS